MPDASPADEPATSAPSPATPPSPASPEAAAAPSRREVLAASAPWLGAALNALPGLGAGYLYQRRWLAWWLTHGLALSWLVLGRHWGDGAAILRPPAGLLDLSPRMLVGLALLGLVSAAEAFLAARRSRMD